MNSACVLKLFHEFDPFFRRNESMLSIEPMLYPDLLINLVNDPVGIFLDSRSENYDLVVLAELCQELHAERTNQEIGVGAIVDVMDECLIKIQHQAILAISHFSRRQEWGLLDGQLRTNLLLLLDARRSQLDIKTRLRCILCDLLGFFR